MRILFDCRYTRFGRHDGISRYTARLVEGLGRIHPVTMVIYDERQLELLPDLPWVRGPHPRGLGEVLTALRLNRHQPDVVFSPMQFISPIGRRFALVTTIHDVIYYTHKRAPRTVNAFVRFLWPIYHSWWGFQRLLLNRADAHLADSETTRRLMAANRATRNPVTVVHLGTDQPAVRPDRRMPDRPVRDLVYMGSFMEYKGVDLLARALHRLPGYRLRLMSRISPAERAELVALAPPDALEFLDGASDAEYEAALARASALVSASHDEGFGLPVVEAMAAGTPVVVRDLEIFREVGGTAALRFADEDGYVAAVRELEDPARWREASQAGIDHAAHFTWDAAAQRLLDVLRQTVTRRAARRRRGTRGPRSGSGPRSHP